MAFSKVLLVKMSKFAQKRIAIRFTSTFYRFIYAVRIWFLLQEVCRSIVRGNFFHRFVLNYNNLLNDAIFNSAKLERGEGETKNRAVACDILGLKPELKSWHGIRHGQNLKFSRLAITLSHQ